MIYLFIYLSVHPVIYYFFTLNKFLLHRVFKEVYTEEKKRFYLFILNLPTPLSLAFLASSV